MAEGIAAPGMKRKAQLLFIALRAAAVVARAFKSKRQAGRAGGMGDLCLLAPVRWRAHLTAWFVI